MCEQSISKKRIRRDILAARDALSIEERQKAAIMMTERICGHQWFYLADTLLCFVSYGSEIDTTGIIQEAFAKGKKVYVPKVCGENMSFFRIRSLEELAVGYKGIKEPVGDTDIFVYQEKDADKILMLMPGVAFDGRHNRIGYGKGFYDRYLADKERLQLRTIAVGFRCQMTEYIPAEEQDIKPYQVICI